MIKITGAFIIIITSVAIGCMLSCNLKKRIENINAIADLSEHISAGISLYKMPFDEIYAQIRIKHLLDCDFNKHIHEGLYTACRKTGLLTGEEESDIIKSFEERIRTDSSDEIIRICDYTSQKLRMLSDKLRQDSADKTRLYKMVSFVAGVSAVIILI